MTSKEYWQMRAHQAQFDEYRYSEDAFFYINGVMGEAKEKLWEKLLYYLTLLTKETGLSAGQLWEKLRKGEMEHYKMSLAEYLALAPKAVTQEEMLRLSMASHLHQIDRVTAMTEEINRYTYLAYEKYYQETKRLLEDTYQRELDRLEKEAVDAESTEQFFSGSEKKADRPALPKHKEPESEPDEEKKAATEAERPKTPELPTKPESRKADKESESQGRSEDKKPDGRPETGQKPEKLLRIDKRKMDQILKEPWGTDERNFSERIWKDRQALANELKRELMQATVTGEKLDAVAGRIAERFHVHQKVARRLVHTENAYMTSKARLARYQQEGIKEYQVIATLDLKTSTIYRSLDKKIFPVAQAQIGVNAPPLHPHCRSTTIAWHGGESSIRAARNPVTGKSESVDGKLNYQEWYDKYVKGNPEAEAREKMWQNRYEDDKQYQSYKKVLGKNAPKNLEEFQKMKYTDEERWEILKSDAARRNKLLKNPNLALPDVDNATIAKEKFTRYLFGGENKDGLIKGELIDKKLGYNINNYKDFEKEILKQARLNPVKHKGASKKADEYYGERYEQRMILYGKKGNPVNVEIGWINKDGKTKMTSIYINEVKKNESRAI